MLITAGTIYQGNTEISKVYQGADLIWPKGSIAPAWPDNYYYPDFGYVNSGRGLGYWKSHFNSGETATIYFNSDDCEGEGGDKNFTYKSKTTGQTLNIYEGAPNYYITANTACDYLWLMPYSHYEAQNTSLPSFWSGCTALCWRQQEGSCGTSVSIPSGDYSNIELLVCLSSDYSYYEGFVDLVKKCPNLKYISNGTLTGSSSQYNYIVLTGSTSWNADSMKFTEWYCPGTTFIVQDNSYWRGIIDWDIAEERNVTFKDINGNYITKYSNDYLTFEILTGGTINWNTGTTGLTALIQYSVNNGSWEQTSSAGTTFNVNAGDKVRFKGNNKTYGTNNSIWTFTQSTAYFNIYGNIMSLQYGDNFSGKTAFTDDSEWNIFSHLFKDTRVINAKDLVLPVTNLGNGEFVYWQMFYNCSLLVTAPSVLPATILSPYCYYQMFAGCVSLTRAPELPAPVLSGEAYWYMFRGCSSLNYIKCLATDISATNSTLAWCSNISPTGTFVKAASMNDWASGSSGIPSGWTVINE